MSQAPETTQAQPQAPAKPRLSTSQMLQLMRLEVDKALRHGYPISCMVVGLDGFDEPADMPRRHELMRDIFRELKRTTFENDVRGLGIFTDRYELAIFPHVTPEKIAELAEEMTGRAHALGRKEESGSDRPAEAVSLSVGISHNLHQGPMSFEALVEEAETGMTLATEAGGDRFIQAREVESEIDRLKEELQHQIREIEEHQESVLGEMDGSEENWGKNLIQQTLALFEREPDQSEGVLRLKKDVIGLVTSEIKRWRGSSSVRQMLESQKMVDRLERRVRKLTESLGVTEEELRRVAAMKNIDLGVSSIYRTVQGLDGNDGNAEQKKEMLRDIFEANMALRDQLVAQ